MIIDLSEADCKEELRIKIKVEHSDENEMFESYSDVLNAIENGLNNNHWAQEFELGVKKDSSIVDTLNDFIKVFNDGGYNENNARIVRFFLQVK